MGVEDLNAYVQMASGLVEGTTSKAKEIVTALLSQGMSLSSKAVPAPQMMGQVQELADSLVTTSRDNREILTGMIRSEVDKAVGRMGFIREDELAALRRHVERVEAQVKDLKQQVADLGDIAAAPAAAPPAAPAPAAPSAVEAPAPMPQAPEAPASDEPVVKKKKKKIIVDPGAQA